MQEESDPEKFETSRGEVEITLTQIDGIEAGKVIIQIAKKHGLAFGRVAAAFKDPSLLGDAIGALTANLDPAEFEELLVKFTKGARVAVNDEFEDLDRKSLNNLFRGHTAELFKLLWYALRLNYTNFFGAVIALMPKTTMSAIPSKQMSVSRSQA